MYETIAKLADFVRNQVRGGEMFLRVNSYRSLWNDYDACRGCKEYSGENLSYGREKEDSRWIENDAYRYLDIGILVKSKRDETGLLHRFIDQIGVFEREPVRGGETANRMIMLVEDGKVVNYRLPKSLSRKFQIGEIVPGNDWRLS